jgi:hypothetical protein
VLEPEAINLEALETLVRVTSMSVELLATNRPAPRPVERTTVLPPSSRAQPMPPPAAAEANAPAEGREKISATRDLESVPAAAAAHEPALVAEPQEERGIEPSFATEANAFAAPEALRGEPAAAATPVVGIEPIAATVGSPAATAPAAPLGGSSRRADAELPIEVSEDERRSHNDARRFARLLVSEIKLYNEQKVIDGRVESNLYERLREEIDRSRQMYDKRVAPNVASRYDYFHHELVNLLAEGSPDKLGAGYPGASAAA